MLFRFGGAAAGAPALPRLPLCASRSVLLVAARILCYMQLATAAARRCPACVQGAYCPPASGLSVLCRSPDAVLPRPVDCAPCAVSGAGLLLGMPHAYRFVAESKHRCVCCTIAVMICAPHPTCFTAPYAPCVFTRFSCVAFWVACALHGGPAARMPLALTAAYSCGAALAWPATATFLRGCQCQTRPCLLLPLCHRVLLWLFSGREKEGAAAIPCTALLQELVTRESRRWQLSGHQTGHAAGPRPGWCRVVSRRG
jgi:hypothetical protein